MSAPTFPVSTATAATASAVTLQLRRFGDQAADLEVDFLGQDSAEIVTTLLQTCVVKQEPVDDQRIAELSLGDRVAALLTLAAPVDDEPLAATMCCPSCGEQLETLLATDELLAYHSRAAGEAVLRIRVDEQRELAMRRPTARDLERWRGVDLDAQQIVRELLVGDSTVVATIPSDWTERIERALAAADPLVDFHLSVDCPECGAHASYELDLQALALERLRRAHAELLSIVHRLASAYHWSEAEIMAVPAARRRLYLSLIESGQ